FAPGADFHPVALVVLGDRELLARGRLAPVGAQLAQGAAAAAALPAVAGAVELDPDADRLRRLLLRLRLAADPLAPDLVPAPLRRLEVGSFTALVEDDAVGARRVLGGDVVVGDVLGDLLRV